MPTLLQRASQIFRFRTGKYDANTIGFEAGAYPWSGAGTPVTDKSAMGIAAVYACVNRIATTIASLDLAVHTRSNRGVTINDQHPTHKLVTTTPNEYQTAPEFWQTLISYAVANGGGHAVIRRGADGRATSMECIAPEKVDTIRTDYGYAFKIEGFGVVPEEDVFCIYNLQRQSPIRTHAENLGLAASAQSYGGQFFSDGQMTGILSTDQPLRTEQMDAVRRSWKTQGGATTRLVPHGLKYHRISIAPEEAQFIQTRKFQAEEIARIFGVPPALIQLESQTTYNNVEQQNIMYGRHTIAPWTKRVEHEIDRKLIPALERPDTFSRFDLTSMYRGDMDARRTYYEALVRLGAMSINEVREKEGLNPVPEGDQHMVPTNQVSLAEFGNFSRKVSGADANQTNDGVQQLPESDDQQRPPGA